MRIVHIIKSGGLYGAEHMLLNLVWQQQLQGLRPVVLIIANGGNENALLEAVRAKAITYERLFLPLWRWPNIARKLRNCLKKIKATHVHSHSYFANILCAWTIKKYYPLVTTLHGWNHTPSPFKKMWWYERLDRLAIKRFEHTVAVSDALYDQMKTYLPNKLTVIYNSIETSNSTKPLPKYLLNKLKQQRCIGFVGRLAPVKGIDVLLQAFKLSMKKFQQPTKLFIIGDGKQKEFLQKLAVSIGIDRQVEWLGFQDNVPAIMKHLQLLIMPSHSEGLPITLLEAMQTGTPVIATSVGGIPKLLGNDERGLLIPVNDSQVLAEKLIYCLEDAEATKQRIIEAKKFVAQHYDVKDMALNYLKVYDSLGG